MISAHDVTAAIIQQLGPVDPMRLNKLLYFAQAASLSWRDKPMFREPLEGWKLGPVVRAVYQTYKDLGEEPISASRGGDADRLTAEDRHVLVAVIDMYGHLSGPDLSVVTHADEAWQEAWGERRDDERGTQPISSASMARSFNVNPKAPTAGRVQDAGTRIDRESLSALFENA